MNTLTLQSILLLAALACGWLTGCQRPATPESQSEAVALEGAPELQPVPADHPAVAEPVTEEAEAIVIAGQSRPWPQRLAWFENGGVSHTPVYLAMKSDDTTGYPVEFALWSRTDVKATAWSPIEAVAALLRLPCDLWNYPPGQPHTSRGIYPVVEPAYEMTAVTATEECGR